MIAEINLIPLSLAILMIIYGVVKLTLKVIKIKQ